MSHTNEDKIDALIGMTEDPVQRATLMVLAKIDSALDANTAATQRIAASMEDMDSKLETHVVDEERILYAVRGGQYVGGVMLSVILAMGWYTVNKHFERNDSQDVAIAATREEVLLLKRQVEVNTRVLEAHIQKAHK